MNNSAYKKLLYLLRASLNIDALPEGFNVSPDEALLIYNYAHRHDIAHLISFVLDKEHLLDTKDGKLRELRQAYLKSIRRCARQDFCIKEIDECFSKEGVAYIPLKGYIIRDYYPERWMRTSGDIDVLVKKTDYEKAVDLAKGNLSYKYERSCSYHTSFSTEKNVEVEIHNSITIDDRKISDGFLEKIWETATLAEGNSLRRIMRDDLYYFHHVFHMLTHFEHGGIGLRFFIDLYLLDKMNVSEEEKAARKKIIEEKNLEKFEAGILTLAKYFFEGDIENDPEDEALCQMMEYVFDSGSYGTISQKIDYRSSKAGGRLSYIKRRVFMPHREIKRTYPILEKHKILTPFYEVRRWGRLIFKKQSEKSNDEIKKTFTQSTKKDYTKMREMLGL